MHEGLRVSALGRAAPSSRPHIHKVPGGVGCPPPPGSELGTLPSQTLCPQEGKYQNIETHTRAAPLPSSHPSSGTVGSPPLLSEPYFPPQKADMPPSGDRFKDQGEKISVRSTARRPPICSADSRLPPGSRPSCFPPGGRGPRTEARPSTRGQRFPLQPEPGAGLEGFTWISSEAWGPRSLRAAPSAVPSVRGV